MPAIDRRFGTLGHCHRDPAAPDAEVDRGIKLGIIELVDHVGSDNPDLRRAVRDERRDIERAHADDAQIRPVACEQERAAAVVEERGLWLDTCSLHQRQSLIQNSSLGDCKDDAGGHDGAALGVARGKGNMADDFGSGVMDDRRVTEGIRVQAEHCRRNDAPVTARIIEAQLALIKGGTRCGERIAHWLGLPLEDAMPLRFTGGLHHLHLTGDDHRLAPIYEGKIVEQGKIDAIISAITADHDERLLSWFDSPPQTNEAGRSASFIAGLRWLSGKVGSCFEMNELGASAGINTMMDRYRYDLGGLCSGPERSPMKIRPEWRGPPPPADLFEIVGIQGCDQAPIDLSDPDAALRVKSYVWPENAARLERMDAAIALAAVKKPDVVKADALDWVQERLSTPQQSGVVRTFNHSIVWQYIPSDRRNKITAAIEGAGRRATADRPIAWMMLETNRATFRHELTVRYWPGPEQWVVLAEAQAHGSWIQWL